MCEIILHTVILKWAKTFFKNNDSSKDQWPPEKISVSTLEIIKLNFYRDMQVTGPFTTYSFHV